MNEVVKKESLPAVIKLTLETGIAAKKMADFLI